MREIKFRGKTKEGKWIYGTGIMKVIENCTETKKIEMVSKVDYDELDYYVPMFDNEEVIPETVGQYTGLKDKNGKEIYEGDIVTGTDYPFIDEEKQNYVGIVVFYDDAASFGYEYQCVRNDKRGISNGINNEFEANENLVCDDLELIGNIYDNPELLGGNNGRD